LKSFLVEFDENELVNRSKKLDILIINLNKGSRLNCLIVKLISVVIVE